MAMNKAEQKRVADLEADVRMLLALRWPTDPMPVPMTREEIKDALVPGGSKYGEREMVARGWFANPSSMRVTCGCSDGHFHATEGKYALDIVVSDDAFCGTIGRVPC